MFNSFLQTSLLARAISKKIINIAITDIRDFASDKRQSVDDNPYGGGPGMVMRVDVVDRAISNVKTQMSKVKTRTILLDAAGKKFDQKTAQRLAKYDNVILLAGRYEGVDDRIRNLVDEEISIGDYVLTGGELPAMVIIDAVSRMTPGFLGKEESGQEESFSLKSKILNLPVRQSGLKFQILLEYPQFTRPEVYKGIRVPEILLSGNHKQIAEWRLQQALKRTRQRRPDLLT